MKGGREKSLMNLLGKYTAIKDKKRKDRTKQDKEKLRIYVHKLRMYRGYITKTNNKYGGLGSVGSQWNRLKLPKPKGCAANVINFTGKSKSCLRLSNKKKEYLAMRARKFKGAPKKFLKYLNRKLRPCAEAIIRSKAHNLSSCHLNSKIKKPDYAKSKAKRSKAMKEYWQAKKGGDGALEIHQRKKWKEQDEKKAKRKKRSKTESSKSEPVIKNPVESEAKVDIKEEEKEPEIIEIPKVEIEGI